MRGSRWKLESKDYAARIAKLVSVTKDAEEQLNRFPGLMRKYPSEQVAVKHRSAILAKQILGSSSDVLQSVKSLWAEGHLLAAGHCARLIYEMWGLLLYAQEKVLRKADESEASAAIADKRLQKLLLGTNSGPALPAGQPGKVAVVNVREFVRAGEAAVPDFERRYDFLCDMSHPTYMHWFFHTASLDNIWNNNLYRAEFLRILEELTSATEEAVEGVASAFCEIYRHCIPALEEEIARYSDDYPPKVNDC